MAGWTCSSPTTWSGTPPRSLAAARPNGSSTAIQSPIAGLPGQLFHNNHDGTFTDVSQASGIGRHIGKGMGVAFADIDGDGLTDIFVANDSVRNFLFRNQGNGTFQEIGLEAGVALRDDGFAIAGMGADLRDFDNDGKPDLVVSGILNDSFLLFRNLGGAAGFEDYAQRTGLLMGTRQFTGWSLGMYDFDNDGWKDLFFALSHLSQLDRYLGPRFGTAESGLSQSRRQAVRRRLRRRPGRTFSAPPCIAAWRSPISTMTAASTRSSPW